MTSHVLLSSERQDWRTPEWFLDLVREVAPIGLDPASAPDNPTRAREFETQRPGSCGLSWIWPVFSDALAFVNPPYGAHLSGPIEPDYLHFKKDKATGERVHVGTGRGWARKIAAYEGERIALVPVRTETEWWTDLFRASRVVLFWRSPEHGSRISFVNPDTGRPVQGSNLASTVFYSGPNPEKFLRVFGPHGTPVLGGKRT